MKKKAFKLWHLEGSMGHEHALSVGAILEHVAVGAKKTKP